MVFDDVKANLQAEHNKNLKPRRFVDDLGSHQLLIIY